MQLFGPGLVLACAGVILGASAGYSQSLDPAPIYNGSPLEDDGITGDWGGLRTTLAENGVAVSGKYFGEFGANVYGGGGTGARWAQEANLLSVIDLDRLVSLKGGTARVLIERRDGRSITQDKIGNLINTQEIYGAGLDTRLAEANYSQVLFGGAVTTKVGRWAPGNDFGSEPLACNFQSNEICGHTVALSNNSGFRNNPVALWGALVRAKLKRTMYAQVAAYRVNPDAANHGNGFDLNWSGTGYIIPFEIGFGSGVARKKPGSMKFGGYYDTSTVSDVKTDVWGEEAGVSGLPLIQRTGRWGLYAQADETVWADTAAGRSLALFGVIAYGDPHTAHFLASMEAGAVVKGVLRSRPHDYLGAALGHIIVNPSLTAFQEAELKAGRTRLRPQTTETLLELDYGARIISSSILRPDIQIIFRPGARGDLRPAVVPGFTTIISL